MKTIHQITFLLILSLFLTQPVDRNFLNIKEIRDIVIKEVESMGKTPEFFYSYNIFHAVCEERILPMLDQLQIDDENRVFYCKMIENSLPGYFLAVFKINPSENQKIVTKLIVEFFKTYRELHFDIDRIRLAKIFQSNVSVLYRIRKLFDFSDSTLNGILSEFVPIGTGGLSNNKIIKISDKFIDFMVFKMIEKILDFLYENQRLCLFTLFELFEQPFSIVNDFNNDIEYISNNFDNRYRNRRLYLIDSLDGLAIKSLNIFKDEITQKNILERIKLEKEQKEGYDKYTNEPLEDQPPTEPKDIALVTPEMIALYSDVDYIDKDRLEETDLPNFKLINICVRTSPFKSQSLEKIYCSTITLNIVEDRYLIENPHYNERLGQLFLENALTYESEFIELDASFFMEESIYNENVYPKFRQTLDRASEEFRRSIRKLRKEFYDDNFQKVKHNFMYIWNKLLNRFFTMSVCLNELSKESLQTNILNFDDFNDDNWFNRMESEFFKLESFYQKFTLKYKKNKEKFARYK